ncbi:MAG: CmpA/NrtA family ABC transporter substrate-binding protein [Opitutae bacterium]|nr:CmpA/NrtA family ABC transporter substrate-binding protein [Opitutae bacterium]MDG1302404.1 CmpA/NrtA family ABC transporter substrate-binding protein [Opitutae bacterium]
MSAALHLESEPTRSFPIKSYRKTLNIGFVAMTDCAPLIAAKELGFFERAGLNVNLSREAGWGTIRERMLHGELDAAHAPASMIYEMRLGLGGRSSSCVTAFMMSHNGSAISFSNELWEMGARDARSMKRVMTANKGKRKFRFAVVLKFSTQNYLLRQWLRQGGIDPDVDVEIVVVPTTHVVQCLMQGHIDGYCAGEPWNSIGLMEGICWCAALTSEVEPMHPEKALVVDEAFAEERHHEHIALIVALIGAAEYCDKPINRHALAGILSKPHYFGVSRDALLNALQGPFQRGKSGQSSALDAIVFRRNDANAPTEAKARWIEHEINRNALAPDTLDLTSAQIKSYFRMDLYEEAERLYRAAC